MDELELKHVKITERFEYVDGTAEITRHSYTSELKSHKRWCEKKHSTSPNTLYDDLARCAARIATTEELTLKIVKKHGQPSLIVETWEEEDARYDN
jgi:hypothetical protein